jgi:hypothetical protein
MPLPSGPGARGGHVQALQSLGYRLLHRTAYSPGR